MKPVFLINETVLFEPDARRLCSLADYPSRAVILHGPVSECLLQLLEQNEQVLTQRYLFAAVWEKQGAVVTTNALYQTIASIRNALKSSSSPSQRRGLNPSRSCRWAPWQNWSKGIKQYRRLFWPRYPPKSPNPPYSPL